MTLPAAFVAKKAGILAALATPSEQYHDLSPKGSVDEGIRDLIARLNGLDGLVTTSSCAGRAAVFVDGAGATSTDSSNPAANGAVPASKPKGMGGQWLFVTHSAASLDDMPRALREAGLVPSETPVEDSPASSDAPLRLIKFLFEPMILHVAAASLAHARPLLAAAQAAGFRESGVQGLRGVSEPGAGTTVAVRTAGLGLSCVVGVVEGPQGSERLRAAVDETYLRLLVRVARERFAANEAKIRRFALQLDNIPASVEGGGAPDRRARRRAREPRANHGPRSHRESQEEQEDVFADGVALLDHTPADEDA